LRARSVPHAMRSELGASCAWIQQARTTSAQRNPKRGDFLEESSRASRRRWRSPPRCRIRRAIANAEHREVPLESGDAKAVARKRSAHPRPRIFSGTRETVMEPRSRIHRARPLPAADLLAPARIGSARPRSTVSRGRRERSLVSGTADLLRATAFARLIQAGFAMPAFRDGRLSNTAGSSAIRLLELATDPRGITLRQDR